MARKLNKAKKEPGSLLSRQRAKLRVQLAQKEADAKQRNIEKYEQEKAARKTGYGYSQHLMGGSRSSSDYNPRARTFEEFMAIAESKQGPSTPVKHDPKMGVVPDQGATRIGKVRLKKI